jgi:hypothetical protein
MLWGFKISYIYVIHMLILIQSKDNQILNDNIIALPRWLQGTNNKKCLKIYKK